MIDPNKCVLVDVYESPDGYVDCYFEYPVDLGECVWHVDESKVCAMEVCLSFSKYEDGAYLQMAPCIEYDYGVSAEDWTDLEEGINYTEETVNALMQMVKEETNVLL